MMSLLHIKQVKVGYMVMAQILMFYAYHLHLAQAQAQQQTLKALEVQTVLLAITTKQLLDVEMLLDL